MQGRNNWRCAMKRSIVTRGIISGGLIMGLLVSVSCLGRLYDGRPNQDTRTSSGGLKFPLGLWKEGETKKHVYKIYEGSRDSERVESITIKQIDFTLGNDPHCLEFYWSVTDKSEKKRYDHHTYTYCPGKSMVHEIQH